MKGISAVIATILMLMITIGLAGMAYTYISGVFTAKTGKIVEISYTECVGTTVTLGIRNDGTTDMNLNELTITIGGTSCSASGGFPAGKINITTCTGVSGSNKIRIVGPANVATGTVYCA